MPEGSWNDFYMCADNPS